jgi:DNA segregation ATPase FtsK/SpoIIIE-like protein
MAIKYGLVFLFPGTKAVTSKPKSTSPNTDQRFDQLVSTLNQIKHGNAPDKQKKMISIRLIQAASLSDEDTKQLLEDAEKIYSEAENDSKTDDFDQLVEDAKSVINSQQKASTALLQRELKINYLTASRIIDRLESEGLVGKSDGANPRKVFIS